MKEYINIEDVEYLGVWDHIGLRLKIYRASIKDSTLENGLLLRQTEHIVNLHGPFLGSSKKGFILMLKGLKNNFFHLNFFNNSTTMQSFIYSMSAKSIKEHSIVEDNIFRENAQLRRILDFEYSLLNRTKGQLDYLEYYYSFKI